MMNGYVMKKWERSGVVPALCREAELRNIDNSEEEADVGDLSCHLGPCDVLACVATEGHVWVCDDLCDPC